MLGTAYEDVADALVRSQSEIHGLVTGLLCNHARDDEASVCGILFEMCGEACAEASIQALVSEIATALDADDLSFGLRLDEYGTAVAYNLSVFRDWVMAFLDGYYARRAHSQDELVTEIVGDLEDIAEVDCDIADSAEAEASYMSLKEHVRVGAMLVRLHNTP